MATEHEPVPEISVRFPKVTYGRYILPPAMMLERRARRLIKRYEQREEVQDWVDDMRSQKRYAMTGIFMAARKIIDTCVEFHATKYLVSTDATVFDIAKSNELGEAPTYASAQAFCAYYDQQVAAIGSQASPAVPVQVAEPAPVAE